MRLTLLPRLRATFLAAGLACGLTAIQLSCVFPAHAQQTTGALEGTIKDQTGALIPGAKITVTTPTLVGVKTTTSDAKGFYHFDNLPPGAYTMTVDAPGFTTLKRQNLIIEVGHLPTVDLTMSVGSQNTVVEVSSETPQIDVTTTTTQTNVTQNVINYVPRGRSFQSVIQFAPGASNEPLMGTTMYASTGAGSPGSQSNGMSFGYSVAGGSDSENSYLVEGQETANLIGGYSHTNVPFDFVKEVTIESSGVPAEYGGALGGVVNVIMQKGTSHYHGSLFALWESQGLDAAPSGDWIYNPTTTDTPLMSGSGSSATEIADLDQGVEFFIPKKSHFSYFQPGFTLGGPLVPFSTRLRDRLFFFVGFNPELDRFENPVNYNQTGSHYQGLGVVPFSTNTNTYYTYARVDAAVTSRIRVFGSWLYQLQRQYGESLPGADATNGYLNTSTYNAPSVYAHTQGFDAPNQTVNTGADITISKNLVSTTRFGYYFENYHDFGYPNSNPTYLFQTSGLTSDGATEADGVTPLPSDLQEGAGYQSQGLTQETFFNSNKAIQVDQIFSFYKSGWAGTHNFKFGYQLNRRSNLISQAYNAPLIFVYAGDHAYTTGTSEGLQNCPTVATEDGTPLTVNSSAGTDSCQGNYGYITDYDYGTGGSAIAYNHGLFIQDSWTIGRGLTLDLGLRDEKEFLPGEVEGPGVPPNPISFGWGQKVAPRLGAAWDVFQNGKMKVFGSYGVFYDTMKLNLAISSFGGEYWNDCTYAYQSGNLTSIDAVYNAQKRGCPGIGDNSTVNWAGGQTPAGLQYIESINLRAAVATCATCNPYEEAVAPNLQPYRQHESLFGADYQLSKTLALEVRYDRRRLDHVIEDSSIFNSSLGGETFVIVNPGQGVNDTFLDFCNFLYSKGTTDPCANYTGPLPPNQTIPAARSYDGLEFRLSKAMANHWYALVSYTYSYFRGNYTGLTSSDQADNAEGGTGGGRDAPDNSRAFDEPYFSYNSMGGSSSGRLPTDRPNKFKIDAYYQTKFLHRFTTDLGVFDYIYQGSPNTSFIQDVGYIGYYDWPVDIYNRGKWADISQSQTTGAVTVGSPRTYRNPVFAQTDFQFNQAYELKEGKSVSFTATFENLFNEHAVTAVNEQVDGESNYVNQAQVFEINGEALPDGVPWYAAAMHPYNVPALLNANPGSSASTSTYNAPQTISNLYGKPFHYQLPRTIRLAVHFTF